MINPFQIAASSFQGNTIAVVATWQQFEAFFKDYSNIYLGRRVYARRFTNGVELRINVVLFPKRAFIELERITSLPSMTHEQLLNFQKERDAWFDEIWADAAAQAGIDLATSHEIAGPGARTVLFQPL